MTVSEVARLASFQVAELTALKYKFHTHIESVILLACKKMVKSLFNEKAEKETFFFQMIHYIEDS